jgi:hypothetical protein
VERGRPQPKIQFSLTRENNLKELALTGFQVAEPPHFFQYFSAQMMCFVQNQYGCSSLFGLLQQKRIQREQNAGFRRTLARLIQIVVISKNGCIVSRGLKSDATAMCCASRRSRRHSSG